MTPLSSAASATTPGTLPEDTAPPRTASTFALSARASPGQNKGTPDASRATAPACIALLRVSVVALSCLLSAILLSSYPDKGLLVRRICFTTRHYTPAPDPPCN